MTAFAATWNVLPFATATGWPFHVPYHVVTGAASVISSPTIDHAPPEPFVHVSVLAGSVTEEPPELAVDWPSADELALREALQLHHNFIGTEHILLGVIREGDGIGAQILKQHCSDLTEIRAAVLDFVDTTSTDAARGRRWLRRRSGTDLGNEGGGFIGDAPRSGEAAEMRTTPAGDTSLSEAARLAGSQPVGSHHLLLAAIADPDTAAARALAALGVDLDQAREALRNADVTGTSDEQPEDAGRRQMVIKVTGKQVTIEATDPTIVSLGQAALAALGDETGVIRGDLPVAASLSAVWQALHDSLASIQRRASLPPDSPESPDSPGQPGEPGLPGSEVA